MIPYIKGVTEKLQRIYNKHHIATAIKPHQTLRHILVHPKDKEDKLKKCGVVYKINCKNCTKSYIGETGRKLETRVLEHQKEADQASNIISTRSQRKTSLTQLNKSAITDHVCQQNHIIDWEEVNVIDREDNRQKRQIRESIQIKMNGVNNMTIEMREPMN